MIMMFAICTLCLLTPVARSNSCCGPDSGPAADIPGGPICADSVAKNQLDAFAEQGSFSRTQRLGLPCHVGIGRYRK
jgi:hypothetical protein